MKKTLLFVIMTVCFVTCQMTQVENTSAPKSGSDSIKTVVDTIAKDTVVHEEPKLPMYDNEDFSYDSAYYVNPNFPQHKFVRFKAQLTLPVKNDSDRLVNAIRYDILNFGIGEQTANSEIACLGGYLYLLKEFRTAFRSADDYSKQHYFDWTVARFSKNTYQDARLYCMAKGLFENKGGNPISGSLTYSNWDKKSRKKIEYNDLFFEKDSEQIRSVVINCMAKLFGVENEAGLETKGVSTEQITPSQNFMLTKDTIYFVYSPLELDIDPEQSRSIKVPVANKQLGHFMNQKKSIVKYLLEE